ncbi:MAG: hypothetical protein H0U22_09355 [Geodermatophilaceae bacterium]|nr:hypothetical protein [Geodermatophilaceae bacterium]
MIKRISYVALAALALVGSSTGIASAEGETIGRAASYVNPDTGAATENPNVNPNSECETPDRTDTQQISPPGTTTNNVHNDACFLKFGKRVNGPASFQSSGVGVISACPDPDGTGPEFSRLTDTNGDGRADLCYMSAFQTTGLPGDREYHTRLNNTGPAGTQRVVFCSDANANGCRDETNKSSIAIKWVR